MASRQGIVAPTDPASTMEAVREMAIILARVQQNMQDDLAQGQSMQNLLTSVQQDIQFLANYLGVTLPSSGG